MQTREESMDSPLPALQDYAEILIGEEDEVHILADENKFSFTYRFQVDLSPKKFEILRIGVEVMWHPGSSQLEIITCSRDISFVFPADIGSYLQDVERDMRLFIQSRVCCEIDGEVGPGPDFDGTLSIGSFRSKRKILFVFTMPYSESDEKDLLSLFWVRLGYACCAHRLLNAVYFLGQRLKRRPTAEERMRELLLRHGSDQVLYRMEASDHGRSNPPPISFPSGLFG